MSYPQNYILPLDDLDAMLHNNDIGLNKSRIALFQNVIIGEFLESLKLLDRKIRLIQVKAQILTFEYIEKSNERFLMKNDVLSQVNDIKHLVSSIIR